MRGLASGNCESWWHPASEWTEPGAFGAWPFRGAAGGHNLLTTLRRHSKPAGEHIPVDGQRRLARCCHSPLPDAQGHAPCVTLSAWVFHALELKSEIFARLLNGKRGLLQGVLQFPICGNEKNRKLAAWFHSRSWLGFGPLLRTFVAQAVSPGFFRRSVIALQIALS